MRFQKDQTITIGKRTYKIYDFQEIKKLYASGEHARHLIEVYYLIMKTHDELENWGWCQTCHCWVYIGDVI